MLGASLSYFLLIAGAVSLYESLNSIQERIGFKKSVRVLDRVARLLLELEGTLESGQLPEASRWQALAELPDPWGRTLSELIQKLRESGIEILPTLKRLRKSAEINRERLLLSKAKSSQALSQVWVSILMVPIASLSFAFLIPGIESVLMVWVLISIVALAWVAFGALWILKIAIEEQWGGLPRARRPWILLFDLSLESLISRIKGGSPPDLAWTEVHRTLLDRAPAEIAAIWGASVWNSPKLSEKGLIRQLEEASASVRKSIQACLMEGRPCIESVESELGAMRSGVQNHLRARLEVIGTKVLKPLFLCVAPSILGLVGAALYLALKSELVFF